MGESLAGNIPLEQRQEWGRKGGLKSAEARRANRDDPLSSIKRNLHAHFEELERAAKGTGAWKDLPLQQRLTALLKVIEYGLGRPVGVDKQTPKDVASEGGGTDAPATLTFE